MRWTACIACLLGVVLVAASGDARERTPEQQLAVAQRHLMRAKSYFMRGNYTGAVKEWGYAYNYRAEPALLFNIAQAYRLSGRPVEAKRTYERYLSELPQAPNRREVQRFLDEIAKSTLGSSGMP